MKGDGRRGGVLRDTLSGFVADDCMSMAAAISFYAIFSLPPLLLLLTIGAGALVDAETVRELVASRIGSLLGPGGADQILALLENATGNTGRTPAAVVGVIALLFGATSAFARLQTSLNRTWGVTPDPARGSVRNWFLKRAISLAMVLALGLFLFVSGASSALIAGLRQVLAASTLFPDLGLLDLLGNVLSFAIATGLFAILFLYVPDARVPAGTALLGGLFTAALFVIGRITIGMYITHADPGSAFGAAGSMAVGLLWLYYNANILFLGAEFTEVWARRRGQLPVDPP